MLCSEKISIENKELAADIIDELKKKSDTKNFYIFDPAGHVNDKYHKRHLKRNKIFTFKCIVRFQIVIIVLMIALSLLRLYVFDCTALFQFIFNLSIVISVLYYIFGHIGAYDIHKDIKTDFKILNADFKQIETIEIREEDNKAWLVAWFFGGLIAISFFFTQVTSATLLCLNK